VKKQEPLTVTLFRGHRASKSFQIAPNWVPRLGLLLCFMIAVTLVSTALAVRFYRESSKSKPWHTRELEEKVDELEQRLAAAPKAVPVSSSAPEADVPQASSQPETAPPENMGAGVPTMQTSEGLFSGIPLKFKPLADPSTLPIEIGDLKASWQGKSLNVYFNIRYIQKNNGTQQGHIVILARGPDLMMSYPSGVLNSPGATHLIQPEKGEFFSVSRFREVKAKFGPMNATNALQQVEVLIFSLTDQLLYHQILKPGETKSTASATSAHPAAPVTPPASSRPPAATGAAPSAGGQTSP
jgi:hypothetical protein